MPKTKPSWINDREVRKKLPRGRSLPKKFDAFVEAGPPLEICWDDLESFGLKREALQDVLPFMRVGSGGMVALWYHQAEPAVVYFGDEGELDVVAHNFDEFLKGCVAGNSAVYDFDNPEEPFRMLGVKGKPEKTGLAELQREFDAWWKKNKAFLEPRTDLEKLRKRILAVGKQMVADGKSKVYKPGHEWWSWHFRIERSPTGLSITYLDYGKYKPLPKRYTFLPLAEELISHSLHPDKPSYELTFSDGGIVSLDNGRELCLMSPEMRLQHEQWDEEEFQKKVERKFDRTTR